METAPIPPDAIVVALNGTQLHATTLTGSWMAQPRVVPCAWPAPDRVEVERAKLEADIAAAEARAAAAKARAAARESELRALLRAELVAARAALADMQHQHDETMAAIRAAAQIDVDGILAEARQLAAGHPERAVNSVPPGAHDAR